MLIRCQSKLVLTTALPLTQLFLSADEVSDALSSSKAKGQIPPSSDPGENLDDAMRSLMDDLGMNMTMLKNSSIFSGDEERFAFARALSRLSEMGSQEWVERGLGMEKLGGKKERDDWQKVRSHWREDFM